MHEPLVSISCTTYNHEKFIRKCLDSFLMQQTNFPFEILIHDDASTDDTANIIREYERNHPELIKPIFQTENQFSKGQAGMMLKYNFPRCKGKYIALCEGDDYWTDPLKLQKQVDLLEANPQYCLCSGYADILNDNSKELKPVGEVVAKVFNLTDVVIENKFTTLTVVFRNNVSYRELGKVLRTNTIGDWPLYVYIGMANKGCNYFVMPEVFGVYRMHSGGVHSMLSLQKATLNKLIAGLVINDITNRRYSYLFLINAFILLQKRKESNSLFIENIISEIDTSFLSKEIKERLVFFIKKKKIKPHEALSHQLATEEIFAVSLFLVAASFVLSNENVVFFARKLNKILKVIAILHPRDEYKIAAYIKNMWSKVSMFYDYNFIDMLLVCLNNKLIGSKKELMDWLYLNKSGYPFLNRLSSVKKLFDTYTVRLN